MSVDKALLFQKQVRDNSEELQNFLKDMDCWEKDMKKKEEELKLVQLKNDQDLPPVRNSFSKPKARSKQKKEKTASPPKKRLSSYDYKSWEKFDVESELKKIDEKKEDASTSSNSDIEEQFNIQRNKQLAIMKKDKGNDFFKQRLYDSAINSYTLGIELDPDNALIPANRAMAFLKKEQYQAAENDCDLCLSLDSSYVKAYLRRGAARKGLKKLSLAKEDFQKALQLEPENKQALQEIDFIDKELRKTIALEGEKACESCFNIESTLNSFGEKDEHSISNLLPEFKEIPGMYSDDPILKNPVTEVKISHLPLEEFKKIVDSKNISELNSVSVTESENENETERQSLTSNAVQNEEFQLNEIQNVIRVLEQQLPPVPTASFQFLTDWKKLVKYPELRYQYLKQFPPERFPIVFKNYMEPDLFPDILNTLSTIFIENGDDVFDYLTYLTAVGRFSTMVMFLSNREKENLKKLKQYLELSPYSSDEIKSVICLFGI